MEQASSAENAVDDAIVEGIVAELDVAADVPGEPLTVDVARSQTTGVITGFEHSEVGDAPLLATKPGTEPGRPGTENQQSPRVVQC